jgi:toxin ParE1/3/4
VKRKPVIPRALALQDVDDAVTYLFQQQAAEAALTLIDSLEAASAYTYISKNAATGSTRYAHALNLPGLRTWPVTGHPYLIFYVEQDAHIDVWRVLHMSRDIPQELQ